MSGKMKGKVSMERILAIYDVDQEYASRFADFMNSREKLPFTAVSFTSLDKLKAYAKEHAIEILLISEEMKDQVSDIEAGQVVALCSQEAVKREEDVSSLYKYQSGDSLVREVLARYCSQPAAAALTLLGKEAAVIGIYSPVNRCMKTSLALTMGQLMGRSEKVLYLSFEEYSGFSRLTGEHYDQDLSDVIYLYRQQACSWLRLKAAVYSWGDLDYIPPVRYGEDLNQADPEEMARLIRMLAADSGYEKILVDVGQMGKGALPILRICDAIYMPVRDDYISMAKVEEFETYLKAAGGDRVLERIRKLRLPHQGLQVRRENYMEQLLWGELGDYVRRLLRKSGTDGI